MHGARSAEISLEYNQRTAKAHKHLRYFGGEESESKDVVGL